MMKWSTYCLVAVALSDSGRVLGLGALREYALRNNVWSFTIVRVKTKSYNNFLSLIEYTLT